MKYRIRDMSWAKRRIPAKEKKAVSVEIEGMEFKQNHMCIMHALYDDGYTYKLTARVNQNDITGNWTVHGINPRGLSTLVDVVGVELAECFKCHIPVPGTEDWEPEMCCSGLSNECGCMGLPTNPVFCDECEIFSN